MTEKAYKTNLKFKVTVNGEQVWTSVKRVLKLKLFQAAKIAETTVSRKYKKNFGYASITHVQYLTPQGKLSNLP